MIGAKYDLTVQQQLPSGRRIPYTKPLPMKEGGKVIHSVDSLVKPAWMRNK